MHSKTIADVRPGQTWASNRSRDHMVKVESIQGANAVCTSWHKGKTAAPRPLRIRLTRFNPTADGFRLVEEATS